MRRTAPVSRINVWDTICRFGQAESGRWLTVRKVLCCSDLPIYQLVSGGSRVNGIEVGCENIIGTVVQARPGSSLELNPGCT